VRFVAIVILLFASACRRPPAQLAVDNPVIAAEVRLEGFDVLPIPILEDFRARFPIRAGDSLTTESEQSAGNRSVEGLQDHGYPYAQVAIAREPLATGRVRLIVRAEPGTLGLFGRVDIAGNRRVDDAIIRRRLAFAPGDVFRRSAIVSTQQRIGALGLFKSVEIRAIDIDTQPAQIPMLVTVEEQNPWQWNLSLGYAAAEQLGVDARISHLNFYGSARRLDLEGRLSRIERGAGVSLSQTDTWHPALSWSMQARHREVDERSFFALSRGAQGAVTWRWTRELAATFSYASAFERSDVDADLEPLIGLQDGMLNAWSVDLDYQIAEQSSSSRGLIAAMQGPVTRALTLHLEQAGGWMPGTFHYLNLIGESRFYRRLLDQRLTLAARARVGAIDPMAIEADIPLLKRFFLGGADEMRGWGIYEVSPLSPTGVAVGGKSLFTAAGEARFPIFRRLRGALFLEAGNVWQSAWTVRFGDLLYDAGPGLRFDSQFGLIRVDFGYQLKTLEGLLIDGRPQKHRWRINFGIGEAF
jgi:outer membrane protein assembly factor BamA